MGSLFTFRYALTTASLCFVLFSVLYTSPARAQMDEDDLLLMLPSIILKAQQSRPPTAPAPAPTPTPTPTPPADPPGLSALEISLLNAHNQARASSRRCGGVLRSVVPALRWNARLANAARMHSADMNRTGVFDHEGSDGSRPSQRVTRAGYIWSAVAENIAGGYPTVRSAVDALLQSTGHCNNIMGSRYRDFGAAKVGRYWTMVFARPR